MENNDTSDPLKPLEEYLTSGEAKKILMQSMSRISKNETNSALISEAITSSLKDLYTTIVNENHDSLTDYLNTEEAKQRIYDTVYSTYQSVQLVITDDDLNGIVKNLLAGYMANGGSFDQDTFTNAFFTYLNTKEGQDALNGVVSVFVDTDALYSSASKMVNTQTSTLIQTMSSSITQAMNAMVRQLPNALSIDASAFTNAFQMNMDASQLQAALASMMSLSSSSKESNLSTLGYADVKDPNAIVIYPKDFESKSEIINILDAYNEEMKNADEDKVITYTDLVGTLMTSVTDIVNVISYVLIAFVAISLVVL